MNSDSKVDLWDQSSSILTQPGLPRRRVLSVCADDYGITHEVSRGILSLALRERVNAIACLTHERTWSSCGRHLTQAPRKVVLGVQFNLTQGVPVSAELRKVWAEFPSLPRLVLQAHLKQLPRAAIAAELRTQWQRFSDATGRQPQFLAGHQHVHQLPGVRKSVIEIAMRMSVAVRNTGNLSGPDWALKRSLIQLTGGNALQHRLQQFGIRHNKLLLGVYDFRRQDYRSLVQQWLQLTPRNGSVLVCHPGSSEGPASVPPNQSVRAAARRREAIYLGSAEFLLDLQAANVRLGPAWLD